MFRYLGVTQGNIWETKKILFSQVSFWKIIVLLATKVKKKEKMTSAVFEVRAYIEPKRTNFAHFKYNVFPTSACWSTQSTQLLLTAFSIWCYLRAFLCPQKIDLYTLLFCQTDLCRYIHFTTLYNLEVNPIIPRNLLISNVGLFFTLQQFESFD